MKRSLSTTTMLFASVSAILGSGWLFSAYYTSTLAGPAALLAWLLGGLAVIVVAFVFAELSSMLPITGSSTRIPQFTHGTIVSFVFSWMIWLSYAALVATEVQAVIQYISFFFPNLTWPSGALTLQGYATASCLMLLISAINIFSLRWLMKCNNLLTGLKIVIPIVLCLMILVPAFKPSHVIHPAHSAFFAFGLHGVLSAISSGGVVFAFNGFKQACELAGEAKKPSRALPIAIIGSVGLTLMIYLLLQVAFLNSLNAKNLVAGFQHIHLAHADSPFASILSQNKLDYMQGVLYLGAIIGPLAAGLMYMSSASRSLYGKSANGYLPLFLQQLNPQGNPINGIVTSALVGMMLFAPLPGWNRMISFLTSLMAISYAIAPVCLLTLRQQAPHQLRPFKLKYPKFWANIAFIICNLMTYFTGWQIISKLSIGLIAGLIILFCYHRFSERGKNIYFDWKSSTWIWPYFTGISLISYLGNFGEGLGILHFGWDCVVVSLFSLAIMQLAVHYRLDDSKTLSYIESLELNRDTQHAQQHAK